MSQESSENILKKFRNEQDREFSKLTAHQFMETWNHYDKDGNCYIEEAEVDSFLKDFVSSVTTGDKGREAISLVAFKELKKTFLEAYDDNKDGRIELKEMTNILPADENFLLFFRKEFQLNSSMEFMKIWLKCDEDFNGFIEKAELNNFLLYLLEKQGYLDVPETKIKYYCEIMMVIFDSNKDGKLDLQEVARLLPVKENFVSNRWFRKTQLLSKEDVEGLFRNVDKRKRNMIDRGELAEFIQLLYEISNQTPNSDEIYDITDMLMKISPLEGLIDKKTLLSIIMSYKI